MTAARTGSLGRPWVELEQPKPARVANRYAYWTDWPPELSERCRYWLRQIERGWLPNRRLRAECYDCSAEWYGVWIWEYLNVLEPAITSATNGWPVRLALDSFFRAGKDDPDDWAGGVSD